MLKKIAVLNFDESLIVNIIMSESAEVAKSILDSPCIELPEDSLVGIGFIKSEDGNWSAPIQEIPEENIEDPV